MNILFLMKSERKSQKKQYYNTLKQKMPGRGNRSDSAKNYHDPTGSSEPIHTPKDSGYDEKQPSSK